MDVTQSDEKPLALWARRITIWLTRLIHWFSAHWLLVANLGIGLHAGLPILAPLLMQAGYDRVANLIYLAFRPLCHQLPERSFFLYGNQWTYSYEHVACLLGGQAVPARYVGNPEIGFKIAVCQRCVSTYVVMLLAGILFSWLRSRIKPLSLKRFGVLIAPLVLDGFGQLLGLWESTWWSRVVTGGLFGVACVWLAYPYLEKGMSEVRRDTASTRRAWKE